MRPGPEFSHRPEVLLLLWRETVEPNAKEVLVEAPNDHRFGLLDVGRSHDRPRRLVPDLVAPLLEEVRVAMRLPDDLREGVRRELCLCLLRGDLERRFGVLTIE